MRVLDIGGDVFLLRFLPGNRRMAVIHGGPSLVNVYDHATLKFV